MPAGISGVGLSVLPLTVAATPSKGVERDNNGSMFGVQHPNIGAAASAGAAIVANANGRAPTAALPASVSAATGLGYDASGSAGLNLAYYGARLILSTGAALTVAAGTVGLTDNATNYVEIVPSTGAFSHNTAGFTTGNYPLFQAVTAGGAITSVTDCRPLVNLGTTETGTAAGGGGSAQDALLMAYLAL